MHSRIDNLYLNPKPNNWILWNNYFDDNWGCWEWQVVAYANKVKAHEKIIAGHMLLEAWKIEKEDQNLDHYHWITNTGCLSVEEIQAISREVWE